jgi:uncharacterized protein
MLIERQLRRVFLGAGLFAMRGFGALKEADRTAFRLWFTFLAEAHFSVEPLKRPREIQDCSSLVRYAYREAFARHDAEWIRRNALPAVPGLPPLSGRSGPLFETGEGVRHFADAETLMRRNCVRVSEDLSRARPGDLLFYQQEPGAGGWHVMVYLGVSQLEPDGERYVIYHTGPVRGKPGEIRRPSVSELMRHPEPRWRPVRGNPAFRGLYRWKILEG